ncbi:MAG TPA: LacI family DNA-binding transcriptional regulator [Usitatibacter sp.]|jgi:LacI family transcriptional regulator|nr:LacI family DNA-binding transcriptional regulator [Usitatibacter sp.]
MKRPVRLQDVARAAGVSLATASRALGSPGLVLPATRQRVEDAAQTLGYVPHGAARALASRRSRTIGAVLPTIDNPIFASATQALARELARASHTLLLASDEYDPVMEAAATRALIERGVDGLVLVGMDHPPEVFQAIARASLPYELLWTLDRGRFHHCVGFDNREASAVCARHLLDLGHRRFAVLSGELGHNDRARDRVAGVRDALAARNIPLPDARVVETPFSLRGGREGLATLWERFGRDSFSALVCGNDLIALGALIECAARGVPVPQALSIVGFDDIELASEFAPGLTTIHVPSSDIGRIAAERLLGRLGGGRVPRVRAIDVELVVRGSTGRPPALRKAAQPQRHGRLG